MNEEQTKKLKFWIEDTIKTMNEDRHQYCINNNIDYKDYYPFLCGELKSHIKLFKEIIEGKI